MWGGYWGLQEEIFGPVLLVMKVRKEMGGVRCPPTSQGASQGGGCDWGMDPGGFAG